MLLFEKDALHIKKRVLRYDFKIYFETFAFTFNNF